ncbi:hypothetical protein Sjap_019195 [Stephania japonica]|uniref:Lipoyl-binding domain-containing protein n=1 Tax=Stephania japonica TaxID=461633 RepID=A0AAP0HZ43_9MAGN
MPSISASRCANTSRGDLDDIQRGSLGGSSSLKLSKAELAKVQFGNAHQPYGVKAWVRQEPLQFAGLLVSWKNPKPSIVCCDPSSGIRSSMVAFVGGNNNEPGLITEPWRLRILILVESLLTDICDTASVAEIELKVGGFQLHVTRDLVGKYNPSLPPSPPIVQTIAEVPEVNGSVPTTSLAISKPVSSLGESRTLIEKATDEGLVILQSPRVGFFRRSRTIKKKRAPPACKEKQLVKEGQPLCYIEQLGGEIPVESDVSGEVIKILREDGEPVGYGDALIAILPSFPGIKKLQ